MQMLSRQNKATEWFMPNRVAHYQCVVVAKRYDDVTVTVLQCFKQNGGRLVLDLCDNDFLPISQQSKHLHQVENLRKLAALADTIVASSESLAQIVSRECPAAHRIEVIGEVPDDPSIVESSFWGRAWSRWRIAREKTFLSRAAPTGVTRLVWFGFAKKRQRSSGMGELAWIAPMLIELGRTYPLHLTVISNSAQRFREDIATLMPLSRYVSWQPSTVEAMLRLQHIALIPGRPDEFTASKSDNRVVTALRAGLAVVADPVPSYMPYDGVIRIGPMEAGLRHYLSDPAKRTSDAARGQVKVMQSDNAERVIARWIEVCGL